MKKAVIVLPTYNERENIKTLIPAIFAISKKIQNWKIHILIVDDNSPDKTTETVNNLMKKYHSLHLIQGKKQGLGKAYIRGFSYAITHLSPDIIFEMDADWSHDPSLIPYFLKEIDKGADFVIGSRYIKRGSIPKDWQIHRKIFSLVGNLIIKFGFMVPSINDWTSGYRAISAKFIKKTVSKLENYNGYVFQIALLDKAYKQNLRITEIPLKFTNRKKGESKINSFQFISNTLLYVFLYSSFIRFVIVGTIGFIIDFGISYILIERFRIMIALSTAISAESAIISNFLLNNFWSFAHKKIEHEVGAYIKSFFHFNAISFGALVIQTISLYIATILFNPIYWYIYKAIIIILFIIPYSYIMYNRFIWSQKSSS